MIYYEVSIYLRDKNYMQGHKYDIKRTSDADYNCE